MFWNAGIIYLLYNYAMLRSFEMEIYRKYPDRLLLFRMPDSPDPVKARQRFYRGQLCMWIPLSEQMKWGQWTGRRRK